MSSIPRRKVLPEGVWPTMITPFLGDAGKSIDWNGIDSESDQRWRYTYPKTATVILISNRPRSCLEVLIACSTYSRDLETGLAIRLQSEMW